MTDAEYERIQERLRQKLKAKPYFMNDKQRTGYEEGLKVAMSIIHEIHKHKEEKTP
jgi:hypothetical protein